MGPPRGVPTERKGFHTLRLNAQSSKAHDEVPLASSDVQYPARADRKKRQEPGRALQPCLRGLVAHTAVVVIAFPIERCQLRGTWPRPRNAKAAMLTTDNAPPSH